MISNGLHIVKQFRHALLACLMLCVWTSGLSAAPPKGEAKHTSAWYLKVASLLEKYHECYGNDDYEGAFRYVKEAAEMGDDDAMWELACMYASGQGTKEDTVSFLLWSVKAAQDNYYRIPGLIENYEYFNLSAEQAFAWLKKASVGSPYAVRQLGIKYENGIGTRSDLLKACDLYSQVAVLSYEDANTSLQQLLENYPEVCALDSSLNDLAAGLRSYYYHFSKSVAVNHLKSAADKSNKGYAEYLLGVMCLHGEGMIADTIQAVEWMMKSAQKGFGYGQFMLGLAYSSGKGITQNLQKAVYWLSKPANQGNLFAQLELGRVYFEKVKDYKKAFEWFEKAAKSGYGEEKFTIGFYYAEESPMKDYAKALYWTVKAMLNSDFEATCSLGWHYEQGYGVEKNLDRAFAYYKEAANLGSDSGLRHMGEFYENGWGSVEQDYGKALECYKEAAEMGNSKAMTDVGRMYEQGLGVKKNIPEAVVWYKKAEKENSDAREWLTALNNKLSDRLQTPPQPAVELPPPGKRLALVVGNGDYRAAELSLANPTRDAYDLTEKLKALGFDIYSPNGKTTTNMDIDELERAVMSFAEKARSEQYDVALFYYSGHAVQYDGHNYLVPVEVAELESALTVKRKCLNMGDVMEQLAASGVATKIVILDACRNNPFEHTRGIMPGGLAPMSSSEGTFLAFSAQAGKRAEDGKGRRNSPYTEALLKALDVPGLNVLDVFSNVRDQVYQATGGKQLPSEVNNLRGRFYFNLNVK